ncbi:D-alanine--D-alanine ligase [Halioglobus japonicus]|uniref:D-alanine--D-alanine ligase n=1 Tax=Halioglobus japonicus TaxID=930805 RepID=A0AAP8SPH3_9GAMM|nr:MULTISPECIES: D-alanine--D-alanine ligase [Halioglobus]AQA19775.1 D-alanine--D-alanine ligase [Halioglobus japonicus]KZX59497.1 D-alanine--D-alanine ligase [Halioglobus sp. HI00S01]PLW87153.1 D-alanine--D-alanine ligase [Halioglobus japonicus]GHD09945.1 D-alanine--D-alanine ligase B [Halioglobus japonicus]
MSAANLKQGEIAVLLGGTSAEREVSLNSGATVAEALRSLDYRVREVDPADAGWLAQLDGVDFAFNILHGPGGEDGCIQGALQALGVPYTGSGVLGSALAMDKQRSKELWQGIGISTGGFAMLRADTDWQSVIDRLGRVFVKPTCEGSSIGMAPASNAEELEAAYREAARYGGAVLAEQFINGPEYTVSILGGRALPSICMETDNEFYDYEAKYISDDTTYNCPSGLSASDEAEVAELALAAFNSLGCAVWGRVDTMRDADGRFYVLEVNTIPGMTSHSLVPMAAREVGMSVPQLVEQILLLSAEAQR